MGEYCPLWEWKGIAVAGWLHFNFWCTDLDSMDYKPCWVDWSMDNEAIDNLNKYSSFLLLFRKVVILL